MTDPPEIYFASAKLFTLINLLKISRYTENQIKKCVYVKILGEFQIISYLVIMFTIASKMFRCFENSTVVWFPRFLLLDPF